MLLAMLMVFNMAASAAADGGPETVPSEGTGSGFVLVEEADLGGSGFAASEQLKSDSGNAVADFRTADPNRKYTLDLTVTEGSETFPEDTESVRMSYTLQNMTAQDGENDEVSWTYEPSARQLVFRWKNGKKDRIAATVAVAADYPAEQDISGRYVLVSGNGAMLGYETFTLDNRDKLTASPVTVTDGKVRPDTWQDAAWVLTHVTGDYYTIRSAETGKYLYISAKNENGYKANSLYLTNADEKTAQRIQAVNAGGGNWSFQLNKAAVNNSGNNPEKGFGSWTYAGSTNEIFHLYAESAIDHDPTKDLSGTWGLYRGSGSNHSFVANRINDKGRLAAIRLDVKDDVIYPQDDIPQWTFEHVNRDWYYVRCGSEYLNISNSGASMSDTPQALYAKSNTGYSDFALMTDTASSKAFALSNVGATLTDAAVRNTEISGTWAIVTESTGAALTAEKKDEKKLASVPYAMTQNGNVFSSEGKIAEWTFTRVNGNWYTVRNQDGKYLDLTHERITLSETETTVYIHESEGRYRLTNGGRYALNNSGSRNGYGPVNSGNNLNPKEWQTLVHAVKEDTDILEFNLNGGTVNETPAALELEPGTTVILPDLDGTKNGEEFLGWSEAKDFYSKNPGTNHSYREVIRAGSEYTAADGQETLYAVWNDPYKKVKFGIRENGVLQNEPSDYPVTAYKGHLWLDDALDEGLWVIDIDGTKGIKDYYMDNRVASRVKKLPTVEQIQEALKKEGSKVTFDPETQYIHWYVLKRLDKEWHVDGVIRNRDEISITYNENVPASERGSVQNVSGGYQFARGTEIIIGAEKDSSEALIPQRGGYVFVGWNTQADGTGDAYRSGEAAQPGNNLSLYARWMTEADYSGHTVTYYVDGVQDGEAENHDYGTPLTARTVDAREGYTFSGWNGLPATMPDHDVEVTGSWMINSHQVKYIIDGVQDGETETYEFGTKLTARADKTREGYTFSGWSGLPETMPDNDVEVTGSWTINSHQVKYIIDGVQDGDTETYEFGTELTARTVDAREGYTFSGWSGLPETMPDNDVEVTGSWTLNEYTVTFTNEDGTVLQSGKVPHGTTPVFEGQDPEKAEDSEHVYRYIGWDQEIVPATADATYTAAYKALTKVILTAESAIREYNATEQRISGFSCSVDGLEIPGAAASGNGKNTGTYETTFTGVTPGETLDSTGNYIVAELRKGTLTITPKAATIIVHDLEMTYGDKEPELTAGTEGTAGMDYLFRKLSREEGADAGTYAITAVPVKDPNYTITVVDGTLTIHPRPVTVTAESKVKVYGSEEPGLTARIDGLADGDTADAIRFALTRTAGENAGEYAIRASGEANQGNYIVTFADGNMTILPSDTVLVRIAANSGTFPYDGAEKNLDGYTVTEISNPLYSESDFAFTGSSELRGTDAGVYRTEMTGEDFRNLNGNFAEVVFEVTNGTLEITRRKIALTSASAEAPYNGAALTADEVTVDGDGFVPGEELVVTVTGIRIQEGISENTFRWTFAEDVNPENYEITAVYGTLTVTPAITRTLTIRYLDENGSEVGTFAREYAVGEAYRVKTPELAGYRAEQDWISGEMGDTDITATVNYIPLTYTLTVEFISEKDGSRVAEPVVLQLRGGQAFRVQAPETAGYTPVRQAAIGTMPNANRRITIAMIPDAPAEETGGSRLVTEIGEYGIPQGPMNNAAAIGDVYE